MTFNWPTEELTVRGRVGIGTDSPSKELEVVGDISATTLALSASLSVDENLIVSNNFQLGSLSVNKFSNDGNLAGDSSLALPTEQAVKTYVDAQVGQKAAINGSVNQDFAAKDLSVGGTLRVSGDLEVQGNVIARDTEHIEGNVSLGNEETDVVAIAGAIRSSHSSGALQVEAGVQATGSIMIQGALSVSGAIAVSNINATGTIQSNRFEGDGSALTGIKAGLWSDHGSGGIYYDHGTVGIGTDDPTAELDVNGGIKAKSLSLSSGVASFTSTDPVPPHIDWYHNRQGGSPIRYGYIQGGDFGNNQLLGFFAENEANFVFLNGKVGIGTITPNAALHVVGDLLGAAKDTSGKSLRICCGKTPEGSTNWRPYGTEGITVTVDTSACGFQSTPIYVVNMHGDSNNWTTTGGSSAYNRTATGFTIYVRYSAGGNLTPEFANSNRWHIEWIAIGN
ncbi:MAG: hypothetical protein AAGD25_11790 [Cyanobacteria bacterium P01_F01_bin.150]